VPAPGLAELQAEHPVIGEVRGEGVFWALELVSDRDTREALSGVVMGRIKSELLARNLLPFLADNRIHVVPPCVVTDAEVAEAVSIYDEVLSLDLLG
jgi:taurine--2-oxoglutarate transaminase